MAKLLLIRLNSNTGFIQVKKSYKKVNPTERAEIVQARLKNVCPYALAKQYDISFSTVHSIFSRYKKTLLK